MAFVAFPGCWVLSSIVRPGAGSCHEPKKEWTPICECLSAGISGEVGGICLVATKGGAYVNLSPKSDNTMQYYVPGEQPPYSGSAKVSQRVSCNACLVLVSLS